MAHLYQLEQMCHPLKIIDFDQLLGGEKNRIFLLFGANQPVVQRFAGHPDQL